MSPDLKENEIVEKTEGIDLSDLGLSGRLYNCLRRGGYNTLTDVMLELPEKLYEIHNFGRTSEQEVSSLRDFVRISDRAAILEFCESRCSVDIAGDLGFDVAKSTWTVLEVAINKKLISADIYYINDDGDYCDDIGIKDLRLSFRTGRILSMNETNSLKKISILQYRKLVMFKGMGPKSINEVLELLKNKTIIIDIATEYVTSSTELVDYVADYFEPLIDKSILIGKSKELAAVIIQIYGTDITPAMFDENYFIEIAYRNPINILIRKILLSAISDKIYLGIDRNTLVSSISKQETRFYRILNNIIDLMVDDQQIRVISGKLYEYKKFLDEWIDTLEGNYKIALEFRCQGLTLEETGRKLKLTRERVRQIVGKALRLRPQIYEEDYVEFIERYSFTKEEFCTLFDLSMSQVNYLFLSCKIGDGDVQAFWDDDTVPILFKNHIQAAFREKVLVFNGECIPLIRDILIQKLLKTFFSDKECSVEEFVDFYLDFLRLNHIDDIEKLLFPNQRALEARISDYPFTIAKAGHRIRYYDTGSIDINKILEEVDIARYDGMEISTLKLLRDWPDVMEQYDIRDEYELHNLIRKKLVDIFDYDISVTRMPLITIGNGDRTKQVEDLLFQMAPVTNLDLALEYEQMYGVRADTVLANFVKCIDVFYHDGIYDLEQKDLTIDEYAALQTKLTEDIYLWDTIVKIYLSIFNDRKPDAINTMTLKKLGFRVYSQYVLRSHYSSADAFFTSLLLKNECLDLNKLPCGIRTIQAFYSALTDLRDNLDLIEFQKDVFYRYDFFAKNYSFQTKENLMELGSKIITRYIDEEYFSIDAISTGEAISDLPNIVRNVFVLNSLLRIQPTIKTGRISNTYIGTKTQNELSQLGIIIYLVKKEGEMSVSSLINILQLRYGLNIEKSRVLYVIENSTEIMYCDILGYISLHNARGNGSGPLYLSETRYADAIEENRSLIEQSEVLIAKIYWRDKYSGFVDYCAENGHFKMRDILSLDFRKLHDNASILNLSRDAIVDISDSFMEWTSGLSMDVSDDSEDKSIIDLFFK